MAASRFGHDFSQMPVHAGMPLPIQPKLTVGVPGDAYEREADRVAGQVMRAPDPLGPLASGGRSFPASEGNAGGLKHLRAKAVGEGEAVGAEAPPAAREVLRSPGRPLDATARAFFEPRLGHDFSRVRVHTDAKAAESSRALNALAYTVGEHIVFAPNRYDHATDAGRHLLAHELAHVVQQGGRAIALQRQPQPAGAEDLSRDLLEISHELREVGDKVTEGMEDLEIFRNQLFLAGKQMPEVNDRINKATVADFVEAAIEPSRALAPFLPPGKRARTSVAKGLTIHKFREELEYEDARLSHKVTPNTGQSKRSKIVKGFYHRATDSIHLTTDTKDGGDSKFGDALHEGVHKYSSPVLQTRLGIAINEGFTQHFADLVSTELGKGIYTGHAYGTELACAKKVMRWLNDGEKLSGQAYFRGEVDPLRQEIMRRLRVNDAQLESLARDRQGDGLCERIKNAP